MDLAINNGDGTNIYIYIYIFIFIFIMDMGLFENSRNHSNLRHIDRKKWSRCDKPLDLGVATHSLNHLKCK